MEKKNTEIYLFYKKAIISIRELAKLGLYHVVHFVQFCPKMDRSKLKQLRYVSCPTLRRTFPFLEFSRPEATIE